MPAAVEVDRPADGPGTVGVLLEGIDAGVAGRADDDPAAARRAAPRRAICPAGWGAFPWAPGAGATALKLTFALSGLARGARRPRDRRPRTPGSRSTCAGPAAPASLYGALPADADRRRGRPAWSARLRTACTALGGALVVLDAPADVKAVVDVWGPVPALDLMRRVKEQFDPERRLAPGRFVGGI